MQVGEDFLAKQAWYYEISTASLCFQQLRGASIYLPSCRTAKAKGVGSNFISVEVKDVLLSL